MKKNVFLLTIGLLIGIGTIRGEQPIRLVNIGPMVVDPNNGEVTLYVPYSVRMVDESPSTSKVSISQQGITSIGGSFYQDSESNVFETVGGWGISTGSIVFSENNTSNVRHIRTSNPADMTDFDRASHYVAFPNLVIATNDTIKVPCRMGIDAATIKKHTGAETGTIYLKSEVVTVDTDSKIYDASLRISAVGVTGSTESEDLVAEGSVIVEKDISIYRTGVGLLFPFAAPYTNMRSGYFAGNFVRRMLEDADYAGHVTYVLGNQDKNGDGTIDAEQYISNALESFVAGKAYMIKARPTGFDYSDLDLIESNDPDTPTFYDKGKFVFNGSPYASMETRRKQLFAKEQLFHKELNGENFEKMINWVVGNSYTSAISVESLYNAMKNTGLTLSPNIYYYDLGSTSYTPYNLLDNQPNFNDLSDIPAMTTVIIRASKASQTGTLTIDRSMQTHGKISSNFLRSERQYNNELVFRVSPSDNRNVYDQTLIALRPNASGSIGKLSSPDSDNFRLYAGDNMSISVQAEGTAKVPLGFVASDKVETYFLSVSRIESMTTEGVWLEDCKTGEWIDLKQTSEYNFASEVGDSSNRFVVHFTPKMTAGLEAFKQSPLSVYSVYDEIVISGLIAADIDASICVSDMQGRVLINDKINVYPSQKWHALFNAGIYMVRIGGERNETVKVLVK